MNIFLVMVKFDLCDLDLRTGSNRKQNQYAKYLDQRSFSSKVAVRIHTLERPLSLDHWSGR